MFEQVKQEIDDKIKTNGNNEITATRLNGVLQDMMDAAAEEIGNVAQSVGDQVEANPTEAATDNLEKIKIGEKVYDIPDPDTSNLVTEQELQQELSGYVQKTDPPSPAEGDIVVFDQYGGLGSGGKTVDQLATAEQGAKADTSLQPLQSGQYTENNFAAFDANGGIKDSQKKASDFATSEQGTKADNAIPMPTGGSDEQILAKDSNETGGVKWVPKPQDGVNGKSAYQIAVDNGFVGSESEWLASLKAQFGSFVPADYGTGGKPASGGTDITASASTTNYIYLVDNLSSSPTAKAMWITVVDETDPQNPTYSWQSIGEVQVNLNFANNGPSVNEVGIDVKPTIGSDNLVKSGGVYNDVNFQEVVDLSVVEEVKFFPVDGLWYKTSSLHRAKYIEIVPNQVCVITTERDTSYFVLDTYNPVEGDAVDFATGCQEEQLAAGDSVVLTVPNDAHWIGVKTYNHYDNEWDDTGVGITKYKSVKDAIVSESSKREDDDILLGQRITEVNESLDSAMIDKDLTSQLQFSVGSYKISDNVIILDTTDGQYRYSSPFNVKKGDVIDVKCDASIPVSRLVIVGVSGEGTQENPYVYENLDQRSTTISMYRYVADRDRTISICLRTTSSQPYTVKWFRGSEVTDDITKADNNLSNELTNLADGFFTELNVKWEPYTTQYNLVSDYIYIGNLQAIRFDIGTTFTVTEYDVNKIPIKGTNNLAYIELNTLRQNTRYVRVKVDGTSSSPANLSQIKINVKPITAMLNNRRLMSNANIKCLAHQGIGLNNSTVAGLNLLSSFWGAYLYGFDGILTNLLFTSDNVPVCVHDSTVSYTVDGRITTYTIASTTYADLAAAATAAGVEKIPTLDSAIKLAKMLGMCVYIVNTPSDSIERGLMLDVVGKYKMNDNTIFMCADAVVDSVINAGNKNVALLQGGGVQSSDYSSITDVITRAITVSTNHPEATIYIWLYNGHSVQNFENAAVALKDHPKIKIGMYNNDTSMNTAGFIERMPYLSMYSSHYSSFGQNRRQVELALATEHPEIVGCTYGNLI